MTATALIIFLLIGAIAGWLAGLIVRGFGFGLLGNIVIGIIGAFLAGWLLPALGISFAVGNPIITSILYALIGAVVLLVIIGLLRGGSRRV
ncbi:MAG TPA: GlsB/YeaQ/YmgE family stress response membrane protein [Rhodanobacter sp.]|nr:GlsB/YeaQ/YmgE family stress response membrane protein [Rhodanobacter sp.]